MLWGVITGVMLSSAFGPGEQTVYDVSYLGVTAGKATLTVGWDTEREGRTVWPLVCVGETTNLASVYPVNDRFISYWDAEQRRSVGADFQVRESQHRRLEQYVYDAAAGEARVHSQVQGKGPVERTVAIEPDTLDLAAAGFRLRDEVLEPGSVFEMPIFTGSKVYRLTATVVGKESLDTALGRLDVHRVTVNGDFSGKLATKGLMTLFYTADAKQLPVRAEAELVLGSVRLEAVSYAAGRTPRSR